MFSFLERRLNTSSDSLVLLRLLLRLTDCTVSFVRQAATWTLYMQPMLYDIGVILYTAKRLPILMKRTMDALTSATPNSPQKEEEEEEEEEEEDVSHTHIPGDIFSPMSRCAFNPPWEMAVFF